MEVFLSSHFFLIFGLFHSFFCFFDLGFTEKRISSYQPIYLVVTWYSFCHAFLFACYFNDSVFAHSYQWLFDLGFFCFIHRITSGTSHVVLISSFLFLSVFEYLMMFRRILISDSEKILFFLSVRIFFYNWFFNDG